MNASGARRERNAAIDLLPPEPGTRRRSPARTRPGADVVDADFVVLPDRRAPGRVHNDNRRSGQPPRSGRGASAGRLAVAAIVWSLRLCERLLQLLPARAFGAAVAGCCMVMFFFSGGLSALATVLAGAASGDQVVVGRVATALDDRDGMKVLSVYGTVENRSHEARPMPSILVEVIAGGKTVARHRVEMGASTLPAGAADGFTLKFPHNGTNLPKVAVSLIAADAPRH